MPVDYKNYVGWWRQFSKYIREERAGNKCEECGAPNGDSKYTFSFGTYFVAPDEPTPDSLDIFMLTHPYRESRVVLTVAHLDHEGGVCGCKEIYGVKCARPDHCLALCQACHLRLDLPSHIEKRRKNLAAKKDAERTLLAGV